MGCHTWFYTKSDKLKTIPEIKIYIINHCKANIKLLKNDYSDYDAESIAILVADDRELTAEDKKQALEDIKYFENIIKNLKFLNKRRKLENTFNMLSMDKIEMINNFIYECSDEYHDLFRINHYNEGDLFSVVETMEFIKNNNISITTDNYNRLLEFWKNNENGVISFG